jgi:hypothetical protein
MLSWEAGRRPDDPSPGDLWYRKVQQTTGFLAGPEPVPDVHGRYRSILDTCSHFYNQLHHNRIRIAL